MVLFRLKEKISLVKNIKLAMEYFYYPRVRIGQRELATIAYDTFLNKRHVIVEGPNGLGKTVSLLSAALKFVEITDSIILYYSRTHRQNENVIRELSKILSVKNHPSLIAVEVRGRRFSCSNPIVANLDENELQSLCNFLKSIGACKQFLTTFSKQNEVERYAKPTSIFSHSAVKRLSLDLMVCPYEATKLLIRHANLIILTHSYFVNRFLRDTFFRNLSRNREKVAIFDECVGDGSEIATPNGYKPIRDVTSQGEGLLISAFSTGFTKRVIPVVSKYRALGKIKVRGAIKIMLSNGRSLSISLGTPILCLSDDNKHFWKKASGISVGDKVLSYDEALHFKPALVEDIRVNRDGDFYELFVSRSHNFVANGVVVHNSHNFFTAFTEENTRRITVEDLRRALLESTIYGDRLSDNIIEKTIKAFEAFSHDIAVEGSIHDLIRYLSREFDGVEVATVFNELERRGEQILRRSWMDGKSVAINVLKVASFMKRWICALDSNSYVPLFFRDDAGHGLELLFSSPSEEGKYAFRNLSASVHVSGTLEPLEAYRDIVGLPNETLLHVLPSPYKKERTLCAILKGYTSKFEERDDESYERLIKIAKALMDNIPGKVGLFLPSYEVLDEVRRLGFFDLERTFFWESKDATSQENLHLLNSFKDASVSQKAALVAVAGGRSSEGVDFPEGEMDASIMMGIPFPKPTRKLKTIVTKLDVLFPERGWCYGYIIPSLAKAVQAIGRAVRSPERKVAILLVDDRYEMPHIFKHLPMWLKSIVQSENAYTLDEFIPILRAFWQPEG